MFRSGFPRKASALSLFLFFAVLILLLLPAYSSATSAAQQPHTLSARGLQNLTTSEATSLAKSYGSDAYDTWINMAVGVRNAAGFNVSKLLDSSSSVSDKIMGGGAGALAMMIIALIIGIVCIVLVGPILCCCKLTKTPRSKDDPEKSSVKQKHIALAVFSIGFIFVFVGIVIAMYSATYVYEGAENSLNGVYTTTGALSDVLTKTSTLLDGLNSSANNAVEAALIKVSDYATVALNRADTNVGTNITTLANSVLTLQTWINSLSSDLTKANTTMNYMKANLTLLSDAVSGTNGINTANNNLTKVRTYATSKTYQVKSTATEFDFLRQQYSINRNFSDLPDVNSYINILKNLPNLTQIANNITSQYATIKTTFNTTVNDAKNTTRTTVSSAISNAQSGLASAKDTLNSIDSSIISVRDQVDSDYAPMILNYFNIWVIVSQIIMGLFIGVMLMGAIGSCAKSPKTTATSACFSTLCVGLVWILCGLFVFIAVLLGTTCTYIQEPSSLNELSSTLSSMNVNVSSVVTAFDELNACVDNSSLSVLDVVISMGLLSADVKPSVKKLVKDAITNSGLTDTITSKLNASNLLDFGTDIGSQLNNYTSGNFSTLNFTEVQNQIQRGSVVSNLEYLAGNISQILAIDSAVLRDNFFDFISGFVDNTDKDAAVLEWRTDLDYLRMNVDYIRTVYASNIQNDSYALLNATSTVQQKVGNTTNAVNQTAGYFNLTIANAKIFIASVISDLNNTILPEIIDIFVAWGDGVDTGINNATQCQPVATALFATTNSVCSGVGGGADGYFFAAGMVGVFGFLVINGLVRLREQLAYSSVAPYFNESIDMVGKAFRRGGQSSNDFDYHNDKTRSYIGMQSSSKA